MSRASVPRALVAVLCLIVVGATTLQDQRFEVGAFGGGRWGSGWRWTVTDTGFAYQNEVTLGVLFRF